MRASPELRLVRPEISRFPRKERAHMPGSMTTPGRSGARDFAPERVAFRSGDGVGTRDQISFAAQWLACAYPCQRFAPHLAVRHASLGDNMIRYIFVVRDLHPLLLAGLPGAPPGQVPFVL